MKTYTLEINEDELEVIITAIKNLAEKGKRGEVDIKYLFPAYSVALKLLNLAEQEMEGK